jgi:nitroreductase
MPTTTTTVLTNAAKLALNAPSVFNTQPWRWVVGTDHLDLYADQERVLGVTDPHGRLFTISGGVALHHARAALAAAGYRTDVQRLPDPSQPDLLARVRLAGPHQPSADELLAAGAITTRHTDRRAYADTPVPERLTTRIRAAAEGEGAHLHLVRYDQMPMLAIAVGRAGDLEMADPAYRSQLIHWTSRPARHGDGVPLATAVRPAPRRVPVREFSIDPRAAGLDPGAGHDRGAVYAILFGDDDHPADWLRAGEALSAVLLTATSDGLSTEPISDVIEVTHTRELVRGLLSGIGYPYLVLRLGFADALPSAEANRDRLTAVPTPTDLPHAPRRGAADVIATG